MDGRERKTGDERAEEEKIGEGRLGGEIMCRKKEVGRGTQGKGNRGERKQNTGENRKRHEEASPTGERAGRDERRRHGRGE